MRRVAEENGVNVSEQIKELENRAMQVQSASIGLSFLHGMFR